MTQFFNASTLTFFVAATCDWGRFDNVASQSSAEEAIVNPNGGAIGVITPDREVYSSDNFNLNLVLYQNLFPTDPFSLTPRLGDASMLTKNSPQSGSLENNQKYHLLADPTMRLAIPHLVMQIDSINGKPVTISAFDTLQALSKVTVTASIRDNNGVIQNINSDPALVTIFDERRQIRHMTAKFTLVSPSLCREQRFIEETTLSIMEGSQRLLLSLDISYSNKQGKVSVYFSGNGTDGNGYTDRVIIGGTSAVVANETQGPTVKIYLDTRSFRSGDLVAENPMMIVDLTDSVGINDAGSGVGHGLEAWLDGSSTGIDLTDFYTGARDNYQAGTIEYQFTGLAPGQHTLAVRAWDAYNNSSTSQVAFSVASSTSLALENSVHIPAPCTVHYNLYLSA